MMGIEEHIIPGKILYLNVCFPHETVPHDKYFVVVGIGESPLLLKINSSDQLGKMAMKKKESHFTIKKSVYTFLDYDSFLDCGTVWYTLITTADVIKQLTETPERIMGDVTADHKNEIVRRTAESDSIDRRHKRTIAEALGKK